MNGLCGEEGHANADTEVSEKLPWGLGGTRHGSTHRFLQL